MPRNKKQKKNGSGKFITNTEFWILFGDFQEDTANSNFVNTFFKMSYLDIFLSADVFFFLYM